MARERRQQKRRAEDRRPGPKYAFDFLDETGSLGAALEPYFGVGLMHCDEPYEILRPIQRMRDSHHYWDEIKWNKVSAKSLPILMDLVDVLFSSSATIHAFVADKAKHDVIGRFGGHFEAYERLARQLVHGSMRRGEVVWIVADEYSTPPAHTFEENVRDYRVEAAVPGPLRR